jgi:hypothetical protein
MYTSIAQQILVKVSSVDLKRICLAFADTSSSMTSILNNKDMIRNNFYWKEIYIPGLKTLIHAFINSSSYFQFLPVLHTIAAVL